MHWGNGWDWGGWLAMFLMMVGLWGLLVVALVYLVRALGHRGGERPTVDDHTARQILDERFARGEIDDQEFKHRREVLSSPG